MLAPSAKARFASESEFSAWCKLYCAEMLVDAISTNENQLTAKIGQTQLVRKGAHWRILRAEGIPEAGSPEAALNMLHSHLSALLDSGVFTSRKALEVRTFLGALDGAAKRISTSPSKDRMELTLTGGVITIVRVGAVWKIASYIHTEN